MQGGSKWYPILISEDAWNHLLTLCESMNNEKDINDVASEVILKNQNISFDPKQRLLRLMANNQISYSRLNQVMPAANGYSKYEHEPPQAASVPYIIWNPPSRTNVEFYLEGLLSGMRLFRGSSNMKLNNMVENE